MTCFVAPSSPSWALMLSRRYLPTTAYCPGSTYTFFKCLISLFYPLLGNHLKTAVFLGDCLQRPLEGGEVVGVLRVGQDGMGEGDGL